MHSEGSLSEDEFSDIGEGRLLLKCSILLLLIIVAFACQNNPAFYLLRRSGAAKENPSQIMIDAPNGKGAVIHERDESENILNLAKLSSEL